MRRLSFIILLIVSGMLLAACSQEKMVMQEEIKVNISDVMNTLEAVNPVCEERVIDDFAIENELRLNADEIVEYQGKITNSQDDCALIFVAKAELDKINGVKEDLSAYQDSLTENDLYLEFADKIERAKDARIEIYGEYVVMVIAGLQADYADIDKALEEVF